jgi:hypothetical protein
MAITTVDELVNALGNNSSRILIDKASLGNQAAGRFCSLWRATGTPGQGAIPTTAAIPTSATAGAVGFTNQTAPAKSYIATLQTLTGNASTTLEVHDRLAHMGGLVLNSTALQTTNLPLDLDTLGVVADRLGAADYGDVQWWLECYADGGSLSSIANINVTYSDGTTGLLSGVNVGSPQLRIGVSLGLDVLRPTDKQNVNIRGINSVQLTVATATAGNFGFTATRPRCASVTNIANQANKEDWASLGLPGVPNDSCLAFLLLNTTTTSGTVRGTGKIVHG